MSTSKPGTYKKLTPLAAWDAMQRWCAWQERCHSACLQKLRQHGLTQAEADPILARLVEEDLLNEERFARSFARGHFSQKQWGPQKIAYALRQRQVSEYCIKKALAEISVQGNTQTLQRLAEKKWPTLKQRTIMLKKQALTRYLLQKGYKMADIKTVVAELNV